MLIPAEAWFPSPKIGDIQRQEGGCLGDRGETTHRHGDGMGIVYGVQ